MIPNNVEKSKSFFRKFLVFQKIIDILPAPSYNVFKDLNEVIPWSILIAYR